MIYESLAEAIADCTLVFATTARAHDQAKPVVDAGEAAREAAPRVAAGETVGILFGRERIGLENHEVALADRIVTLPVNPAFASLNLAQAVLLVGYEWFAAADATPPAESPIGDGAPASKQALISLFEHLEEALDRNGFLRNATKRPSLVRNLRNLLQRAQCTEQEVRTLHGVITAFAGPRDRPVKE